jgi:hypothetical protein
MIEEAGGHWDGYVGSEEAKEKRIAMRTGWQTLDQEEKQQLKALHNHVNNSWNRARKRMRTVKTAAATKAQKRTRGQKHGQRRRRAHPQTNAAATKMQTRRVVFPQAKRGQKRARRDRDLVVPTKSTMCVVKKKKKKLREERVMTAR